MLKIQLKIFSSSSITAKINLTRNIKKKVNIIEKIIRRDRKCERKSMDNQLQFTASLKYCIVYTFLSVFPQCVTVLNTNVER